MPPWKIIAATGIALIIIAIAAICSNSVQPTGGGAGSSGSKAAAPTLAAPTMDEVIARGVVQTLDGSRVRLHSFRGKWLLINIWATSCGPCIAEMPALNQVWDTQHPAGLQMIGISDEDPEDLWRFLNQIPSDHAIHYPIANDPGSQLKLALNMVAIPRTIIVDPKGQVKFDEVGAEDAPMFLQALSAAGFPVR